MIKEQISSAREVWECTKCGTKFEPTQNCQCPNCTSGETVCIKNNAG